MGVVRDSKFRIEAPGHERKANAGETFQFSSTGPSLRLLSLGRDRATEQDTLKPLLLQSQGLEVNSSGKNHDELVHHPF